MLRIYEKVGEEVDFLMILMTSGDNLRRDGTYKRRVSQKGYS